MKTIIRVPNLMSHGCRCSIHEDFSTLPGIYGVRVDPETLEITVEHTDETSSTELHKRLREMGYRPE